jgi:hypothetical protein
MRAHLLFAPCCPGMPPNILLPHSWLGWSAGEEFTIGLELATGMSPALGLVGTTQLQHGSGGGSTEEVAARLVDGENLTTAPEHMLLLPYDPVTRAVAKVVVHFNKGTVLAAMKVRPVTRLCMRQPSGMEERESYEVSTTPHQSRRRCGGQKRQSGNANTHPHRG